MITIWAGFRDLVPRGSVMTTNGNYHAFVATLETACCTEQADAPQLFSAY